MRRLGGRGVIGVYRPVDTVEFSGHYRDEMSSGRLKSSVVLNTVFSSGPHISQILRT
jgi:hypothetical protein